MYKLLKSGLSGNVVKLLKNMYSKIRGTIKVNNYLYETIKDQCGSNQGGPLSPNMFRYMLADLISYLDTNYGIVLHDEVRVHLLWADDLVLMSDSPEGLQKQLDGLFTFCSKYQMIVNELKTKIMIYGKVNKKCSFHFNSTTMIPYITDKSTKATFQVYRKCKHLGKISPLVQLQLYDSFVSPVLDYASEIWCKLSPIQLVERIQLRYLKYMLSVKDSTCTPAVYGETGRLPTFVMHHIKLLKYWFRIVKLSDTNLTKKAYVVLCSLFNSGYKSWVSKIYDVLKHYDLLHYWENEQLLASNLFVSVMKKAVQSKYVSSWNAVITEYPVLRTYCKFKKEFKFEMYLYLIKDPKLRKCLSRFRLSSHKLQIEMGRHCYPKKPEEQRICKLCNLNEVESEIHFLLQCPFYTNERIT